MLVFLLSICVSLSIAVSAIAAPPMLHNVRSGWHGTFVRIVFDVQGDISYQITSTAETSKIVVAFPGVSALPAPQGGRPKTPMIEDIRFVDMQGQVSAEITLTRTGTVHKHYRLRAPERIVLDIAIHAEATPEQKAPVAQSPGKEPERATNAGTAPRVAGPVLPPATPPVQAKSPAPESQTTPATPAPKELPRVQESRQPLPPQTTPPPVAPPVAPLKLPTAESLTATLSETELLGVAERQWQQGQFQAAQASYRTFLQRFPEYPHSHLIGVRLADMLHNQQQYQQALEAYARVVAMYPGSEGAIISEMRMAELGVQMPDLSPRREDARFKAYYSPLEALRQLIQEYPFSPLADVARFKIGVLQLQRHDAQAALAGFRELLQKSLKEELRQEIQTKYRQALQTVMTDWQGQGKHSDVLRTFFTHKGLLSPGEAESPDFLLPVAISYARLGLLPEAQSLFQMQLRAATPPSHRAAIALEQAHVLIARGALQDAHTLLKSTEPLAEGATREHMLLTLGKLALRMGQSGEAVQYLRKGQEFIIAPAERADLFSLLGEAYAAQGRHKEAEQAFQQCVDSAMPAAQTPLPVAETCLLRAAGALFAQRQYAPALQGYQKLLEAFPQTSQRDWTLLRMAVISQELADTTQMRQTLETLRDTSPSPLWQKVALDALEDVTWQQQFRERLAEFQNRLLR